MCVCVCVCVCVSWWVGGSVRACVCLCVCVLTVLLTHAYFASPMLKLKPLDNALSLTVLQSDGILSLVTFVTLSPPMPSKPLKTHLYKNYHY